MTKKKIMLFGLLGITLAAVFAGCASQKKKPNLFDGNTRFLGDVVTVERSNGAKVNGLFYRRAHADQAKLPLVINVHGGAFIAGAAADLDRQSQRISEKWGVAVFNIDYTLVPKRKIFSADPYIQLQIDEVSDAVRYFRQHAGRYHIDPEKIILLGYSAGGYLAAAASTELAAQGQGVHGQVLAYTFVRDLAERYQALPASAQKLPSTLIVYTEAADKISETMRPYERLLRQNGVATRTLEMSRARHGFMEEHHPDEQPANAQGGYVGEAEQKIKRWLDALLQEQPATPAAQTE